MNRLTAVQISKINFIVCSEKSRKANKEGLGSKDVDTDLLEKILSSVYEQNENGFYSFPDIPAKAAKLACEISLKKPFAKYNLATAIMVVFALMEINNYKTDNIDIKRLSESIISGNEKKVKKLLAN